MRRPRRSLSSTSLIRSFNVVSVLQTLYREGACSKARIAEITRMSPATVTRIVSELVRQGVVAEHEIAESTGGRKPVIFRLSYDKLYIIGIELIRDRVTLAVCDLRGKVLDKRTFNPYSLQPSDVISEIAGEFNLLVTLNEIDCEHILGIGLAISGIVNSESGVLLRSVNLGWQDVRIRESLEQALGFRVVVETTPMPPPLPSSGSGAPAMFRTSLLKTDTGVGAGIVCERALMTGAREWRARSGTSFSANGHECVCGQHGCLRRIYGQSLLRRYESRAGTHLDGVRDFLACAAAGDPVALSMVSEAAGVIGTAAAMAATLLDLDLVVIGGLWGELGASLVQPVQAKAVEILDRSGLDRAFAVRGSALGEDSDVLGAAGTVINRWFTPPI